MLLLGFSILLCCFALKGAVFHSWVKGCQEGGKRPLHSQSRMQFTHIGRANAIIIMISKNIKDMYGEIGLIYKIIAVITLDHVLFYLIITLYAFA